MLTENFKGQNKLYGKVLAFYVYDAILKLSEEGHQDLTNKQMMNYIIQKHCPEGIPKEEMDRLNERITKASNSMVYAGLVERTERKTELKTTVYTFNLKK